MKMRLTLAVAALAAFGIVAGSAATASAHPTQTSACTGCHGAASAITLTAVQTANDGTNATYRITLAGGSGSKGYAVLNGSTNVAHASASTGVVVLPVGKTYSVWGVDTNDGAKSVSISPVALAPVPDPTPVPTPTPTPDPTTVPTPTPTPDPTPTPVPAPVPGAMCRVTVRILGSTGHALRHATVTFVNTGTGRKFVRKTTAKGYAGFGSLLFGTYKVTASCGSSRVAKTVTIAKATARMTLRVRPVHHDD